MTQRCQHIWKREQDVGEDVKTLRRCTICGVRFYEHPQDKMAARAVLARGMNIAHSRRNNTGKIEEKKRWALR